MSDHASTPSRRRVLQTAAAASGLAIATGATGAQETVTIDMTDGLVFDPDSTEVAPGTTVVWETVGSIPHSVTAYDDGLPEEAEYFASGGFDNEADARDGWPDGSVNQGETYEHTFEVEGEYEYFCIPHEGAGMVASLTVAEGAGGDGGGGGGGPPKVPTSALDLTLGLMGAMAGAIALVFFFIKYGGSGEEE